MTGAPQHTASDPEDGALVIRLSRDVGAEARIGGRPDTPRLREVIGQVLREERLRQQRTLADVARRASVSLPYLSEVERGRKEVSSEVLDAIRIELGLDLAEVLTRSVRRLRLDASSQLRLAA